MLKLFYKPWGILAGVLGGLVAGQLFKQVWKLASGEDDAPDATDPDIGWTEAILAATVQGAVFGGVKAAVDRGGASWFAKATGTWPA